MRRTAEDKQAFCEGCAEAMKLAPTPAEAAMWEILQPLGFHRQVTVIGKTKNGGVWSYILDFAWGPKVSKEPNEEDYVLAVEVDGSSHDKRKGRDRRRDTRLRGEGIKTIRIKNSDVMKWPDTIRETIERIVRLG